MAVKTTKAVSRKKAQDIELKLIDVHPDHDNHLCHIVGLRNMKKAGTLAKDARFLCYICGRAAKSKNNLCQPIEI